jgi:UDP-N-acetylmuramoyl-L-alanyl-D-glutamate--2,6-diaminopimelate ligase/murE/murF fusion protein
MNLAHLIAHATPISVTGFAGEGPVVSSLHYRAQEVEPGGVFVALKGLKADGYDFIDTALARGAAAVVAERPIDRRTAVIVVPNARRALAELSAAFYGHPSQAMTVVAVTGTNGKTTTTYLIESILGQAGIRTGVIGTINYRYNGRSFPNPVTTPESLDLQRMLADMRSAGVTHAVLEASSHAIDLARIHACWLDAAVFTNLSQDHLDFHGDMPSYWAAKKRLFTTYLASGPKADRAAAVINMESSHGRELAAELAGRVVAVGRGAHCEVRAADIVCGLEGIRGRIVIGGRSIGFSSPLVGGYNLENILCAAGVAAALGTAPETITAGISALSCVPGRLERVVSRNARRVYVDYSHTPDALEHALRALRGLSDRRIVCVFGCGGDRDRTKRAPMGAIAARWSDAVVVTSDNPRSEDPLSIISEILPGLRSQGLSQVSPDQLPAVPAGKAFAAEPDRRRAIAAGLRAAHPGDMVLIAGKGHETYQVIGNRTIHFDDREEAAAALETLEGQNGP